VLVHISLNRFGAGCATPFDLSRLTHEFHGGAFFSLVILEVEDFITAFVSIRSIFERFPQVIANTFCFCYIMESRFPFFAPVLVFQSNSPYFKEVERWDILMLDD